MLTKEQRLRGMLYGVAIGDALGLPVEGFQAERIAQEYGRVTTYLIPSGRKWYTDELAGDTTDDWQLSAAVAEALIEGGLTLECHIRWHVKAWMETTKGWGGTTKTGVQNLANGVPWLLSGDKREGRGKGNGPPMKVAPFVGIVGTNTLRETFDFIARLTLATHPTEMAVSAAFTQFTALYYCLRQTPEKFDRNDFIAHLVRAAKAGERFSQMYLFLPIEEDNLAVELLRLVSAKDWSTAKAISEFGRGSCYCFHSLPFTYFFFLRQQNIESLYDVISSGGDADTNGSMLAALLGALHGPDIFPNELKSGLIHKDQIEGLIDRFCAQYA